MEVNKGPVLDSEKNKKTVADLKDGETLTLTLGNKISNGVDKSTLLYTEDEIREMTIRILENFDNLSKKIQGQKKFQKPKLDFNSIISNTVSTVKIKNNPYFLSFEKFINENEIYEFTDIPEFSEENKELLKQLFKENILRLAYGYMKEMALFYKGELEIDEKTSFGEDFLQLVTLVKYLLDTGDNDFKKYIDSFATNFMGSKKFKYLVDLGVFLKYLINEENYEIKKDNE